MAKRLNSAPPSTFTQTIGDMRSHIALLQRRLAKAQAERDAAVSELEAARSQAEMAERASRDVARDRDYWREQAKRATAALSSMGGTHEAA